MDRADLAQVHADLVFEALAVVSLRVGTTVGASSSSGTSISARAAGWGPTSQAVLSVAGSLSIVVTGAVSWSLAGPLCVSVVT